MNRPLAFVIFAHLLTVAPCNAATEKEELGAPFSANTPSKTLNARFESTKRFQAIPIITAKRYYTDYIANEAAADLKYRDKPFVITGIVAKISKNFLDETYLSFWGDKHGFKSIDLNLFQEQICRKDGNLGVCSAAQRAAMLKKKDCVKLECFGGAMIVQTPQATKCILAP